MRRASGLALRSIASGLVTVLCASVIVYVGLSLASGDPAVELAGSHPTAALIRALRRQLGLDRPLAASYVSWLSGILHGRLGNSITFRQPVGPLIAGRIGTTFLLVGMAFCVVFVVGVVGGLASVYFRRLAPVAAILIGLGIALPSFIAALLFIELFGVRLGWLPVLGTGGIGLAGEIWHLILPAAALAVSWCAYSAQIVRTTASTESFRPHVETGLARGLPSVTLFRRHVVRNALMPIVTILGVSFAGLLTSSVVIETVFSVPGIGALLVQSVLSKDYNVVLVIVLIYVCVFVIVTRLIDIAALAIDPRIRAGASSP